MPAQVVGCRATTPGERNLADQRTPSQRWVSVEDARAHLGGDQLCLDAFDWLVAQVDGLGGAELRVAPTQLTWARRRGFAYLWSASRWLGDRGASCVLSLALVQQLQDPRWKQVVQVRPGLWMHHLEVTGTELLDDYFAACVAQSYLAAG